MRVSDLWAFWKYIIGRYVKKYSGNKDFLITLIEQARYFYEAAEDAPIKSQPLLYYYSFLNLAKVIINVNSLTTYGTNFNYKHGIDSCIINKSSKLEDLYVEIKGLQQTRNTNNNRSARIPDLSVAYTFMQQMGDRFICPPRYKIKIIDMLHSCIGIHRTYCETYNIHENFFKITQPIIYKEGRTISAEFEIEECDDEAFRCLSNANYHMINSIDKNSNKHYKWVEEYTMTSYTPSKLDYYMLSKKLKTKGIWYYTDGEHYHSFISTCPIDVSTESIIYALMFFFGSITRYHPYLFDNLLTDKEMWMISEFLETQPKQFLYAVTSRTIESAIMKSKIANLII